LRASERSETVRLKARQHDAVADEADIGRLVAEGDRHFDRAFKPLARFRRRAAPDRRPVFLVEVEPGKAEARPRDAHRRLRRRRHAHIVRVIDLAGSVELARELDAGARRVAAGLEDQAVEGEGFRLVRRGAPGAVGADVAEGMILRGRIIDLAARGAFGARQAAVDDLPGENPEPERRQHGAGADNHQLSVHPRSPSTRPIRTGAPPLC
jgi:hypothetical protein